MPGFLGGSGPEIDVYDQKHMSELIDILNDTRFEEQIGKSVCMYAA